MQIILFISLLLVAVQAAPQSFSIDIQLNEEWETYKLKFNKNYDSLIELRRRIIWEQNLKYIQQHNLEYDLGKHSYNLGLNQFADLTNEEFKSQFIPKKLIKRNATGSTFIAPENIKVLPPSVDWRTKGYVTPIKNQQSCGSCWAFSTTGSLEGQHKRKTGTLISLSEQQLVDCSQAFGNNGCGGGLMDYAFTYIEQYGIESESSYPYTATDGTCVYDKSKVVATCTGYVDIPQYNEAALAAAVATVGPISVGIDASQPSFQLYQSGIYDEPDCSSTSLDHGVLAVGYGSTGGNNFWLVKNSWGTTWGMNGFIEMSKDTNNQCGIATSASYPLV